ncbi:MAG TPA: hypothetical protein VMD59_03580 [Acidimicrobiales bacterium]|nr:hypothetical protein [Acidimicrobiales bacterium]
MTITTRSSDAAGSRAVRPGFGRAWAPLLAAAFTALLGVLAYGVYQLVSGRNEGSLGAYAAGKPASWLPKEQLHAAVDHTLVGTYAHPAITVAGDDVRVTTPSFSAFAVVTGPLVPGEGLSYQPQFVVGTWTVHIWDVTGHIPLAAADFDSIDHLGTEFRLEAPQGTTMPREVSTGQQATFELRAVLPIGEDLFRWAPNGNDIVAKWDNQVEND